MTSRFLAVATLLSLSAFAVGCRRQPGSPDATGRREATPPSTRDSGAAGRAEGDAGSRAGATGPIEVAEEAPPREDEPCDLEAEGRGAPPIVFESPDYDESVPRGPFALADLPAGTVRVAGRGETEVRRIEAADRVEVAEYGLVDGGWELLYRAAAGGRTRGGDGLPRVVVVDDYPIAEGEAPVAVLALVEAADRPGWVFMDDRPERSLPLVGVGVPAAPAGRTRALARSPTVRYMTACPGLEAPCLLYGSARAVARARDPVEPPGGWWLRELALGPEPDRSKARPVMSLGGEGALSDLRLEVRQAGRADGPGTGGACSQPVFAGAWLCRAETCTHAFAWQLEDQEALGLRIERDGDLVVASVWEAWYGRRLLAWFDPATLRRVDAIGLSAEPHEPRGAPFQTIYPFASPAVRGERRLALLGGPGLWPGHAVLFERLGERGRFVRLVLPEIDDYYDPFVHPRWPAALDLRRSGCPRGTRECLLPHETP